ncbi:Altered inheritance of mitochondria protein 9 [Colletotrichum shisoi]|uniref:Altered inheritance of mitochondria protein 9 n=1 Tax=Colletotrichum shisoi TaxID=2078593 RepID=A0A5Q4BP06_9PEZI|nr:Altered inheritance of mitochondria protein 9 [Colletotrichum shisoi]
MPNPRDGLVWEDGGFDPEPRWTREPSLAAIEEVCRRQLGIGDGASCEVSFYAAGAFNKLYLVQRDDANFIMRVSLPVDPGDKTRGEVATLRWLRRWTSAPVPQVFAFDDSNDNEIGFEWILMELMPGVSAYKRWRSMSMAKKTTLVEEVAEYQTQIRMRQVGFQSIGTLRTNKTDEPGQHNEQRESELPLTPCRMVSLVFFWGDHYDYDVPRGPFRSSHDWLSSFLNIIILDSRAALREAEDKEDEEDAAEAVEVAQKLLALLPRIFPSIQHPPERSFLWHDDLSLQNILDDMLSGGEPDEELDNEGKDELYWIHLMEFEQTQLRKVYAARMQQLRPDWAIEAEDDVLKRDFLEAVHRCRSGFYLKRISQWVDAITAGDFRRLAETLQAGR